MLWESYICDLFNLKWAIYLCVIFPSAICLHQQTLTSVIEIHYICCDQNSTSVIWLIFFYGNYRPVISLTQSRCCCDTEINGWYSSEELFSLVFIHRDPEKLLEISHFKLREVQNTCRCPFKFIESRYFVYILWFLHAVTRLGKTPVVS